MNQVRVRSSRVEDVPRINPPKNYLVDAADWLTQRLGLEKRLTSTALAKVLWVGFLALIYIYFQHSFDRLIRKTEKAEKAVDEQRALFISHKANYLFASKQSEIEKKLDGQGFTNGQSPIKISVVNPK